jgi:hypothetical protein
MISRDDVRFGSMAGFSDVQMAVALPSIPTVGAMTADRRRDGFKTDRHTALPRNVETGNCRLI